MMQAIENYLEYLASVKNSSPHTIANYSKDLRQFIDFLTPPGVKLPPLHSVTHGIIVNSSRTCTIRAWKEFHRKKTGGVAFVFKILRA